MTLYMAVTADKYELPLVVTDTAVELAAWGNTTANSVYSSINHGKSGKRQGFKYVKVSIERE